MRWLAVRCDRHLGVVYYKLNHTKRASHKLQAGTPGYLRTFREAVGRGARGPASHISMEALA